VRDLKGTMQREGAETGVFITLEPPTKDMITEAAAAGIYEPEMLPGQKYPRLQILTVEDILAGAQVSFPRTSDAWGKQAPGSFKRAKRQTKEKVKKQRPMV